MYNGKRYLACLNVTDRSTFESFQTCKINHILNCNDKYLINLISCKICGLRYVGSAMDPFFYCWNNYRNNSRRAEEGVEHMQADLSEPFASHGHNGFLEDCIITLIDKADGANTTRGEEYWRRVMKTVLPYGLITLA